MTDFARWDTASESSAAPPPFSIHRPAALPRRGMERRPFFSRIPTFTKWATAAWSIVTAPFAFVRALFGEWSFSIVDGSFCSDCADVHQGACPRSMRGLCDVCGPVTLDRFGNCSLAGRRWRFHNISARKEAILAHNE